MTADIENWDTTLREGEQQTGVNFSLPQKIEIADALLNKYKTATTIEIHCYRHTLEEAKALLEKFGKDRIILHHRLHEEDIDVSKLCGKNVLIGMFVGTSDKHLASLGLTRKTVVTKIENALEYANQSGVKVGKMVFEGATDTDLEFLKKLCKVIEKSPIEVKTISPAMTVERNGPELYGKMIKNLMKFTKIPLIAHCHNDLGGATLACWEAYKAGLRIFNTSVLGLGERAGITHWEEWAVNFKMRGLDVNTKNVKDVCEIISRYSGIRIAPHVPIIGSNVHTHKAGVHARKVLIDPSIYEPFSPETIGKSGRTIVLSHLAGNSNVKLKLKNEYNIDLTKVSRSVFEDITEKVRVYGKEWKSDVPTEEFEKITAEALGMSMRQIIEARKFSQTVSATMLVKVDSNHLSEVSKKIRMEIKEATDVNELLGKDVDLKVDITTSSLALLDRYTDSIRGMNGVIDTSTYIVAKKY